MKVIAIHSDNVLLYTVYGGETDKDAAKAVIHEAKVEVLCSHRNGQKPEIHYDFDGLGAYIFSGVKIIKKLSVHNLIGLPE
jgi:hypothetical protein